MGNNFVPKSLDPDVVDQWYKISDKEAFSMARRLIRDEGVMCGKYYNATKRHIYANTHPDITF